ncbi:uncharacterized protein H6S33_007454 [Morchella sextelata]|uniref:uncharacterized protein n=1 Tax=Morchella sextelata TaxID=1174677 RepID=UPI001D041473|nr:uncharacterized protein H6S33_007454 [Morchella sextelata]KAH0603795.1 hypothetical protein H6S33_007454 [Morchella sextelata]
MKDEQVSRLLQRKSDISSIDTHRNTALHKATFKGNREILHLLLEKGANPHLRSNDGRTPLQIAVQDGNKPMVSLLLTGGANTSTRSRGPDRLTVLHEAVLNGDEEMVVLLLEAGADTSARSKSGLTVLHLAVQRKNIAIADLLLRAGVEVSARSKLGATALHLAVQHGIAKIVDLLLKAGADTSGTCSNIYTTRTILEEAVAHGNVETIRLLLKSGVVPPPQDFAGGWFGVLINAIRDCDFEVVDLLLKAGARTCLKVADIATIFLNVAVSFGSEEKLGLLLEASAVFEAERPGNTGGWGVLILSMLYENGKMATSLFKAGAKILWKNPSITELILYEALESKYVERLESFYGADLDIPLLLDSIGGGSQMLHFEYGTPFEEGGATAIHLLLAKYTGVPARSGCKSRALDIIVQNLKENKHTLADSSMRTGSDWVVGMLIVIGLKSNPIKKMEKLEWIELTFPTGSFSRKLHTPFIQEKQQSSPTTRWHLKDPHSLGLSVIWDELEILSLGGH